MKASLKIVTIPHPALRAPSQPVKQVDKKLLRFLADLEKTLLAAEDPPGVGLSAPQVGKNWQLFLTYLPPSPGKKPQLRHFINPKIIKTSKTLTLGPNPKKPILEGCLSIPKVYAPVLRHQTVILRYQTINPQTHTLVAHTETFKDFAARVVQHEFDHLQGVLFIDRAQQQKQPLYLQDENGLVKLENHRQPLSQLTTL